MKRSVQRLLLLTQNLVIELNELREILKSSYYPLTLHCCSVEIGSPCRGQQPFFLQEIDLARIVRDLLEGVDEVEKNIQSML